MTEDPVFADQQQVWDWLNSLRRRRTMMPPAEAEEAQAVIHAAVRRVAGLRFDGALLDRVLIARHAGMTVEGLVELLAEREGHEH